MYRPLRFRGETTWLHLKVTCLTILYSQVPPCFLNWEVEIRNTLGAQTANAMAAKNVIQSQRGFKTKHRNKFLLQCFLSLPFAEPGSYTLSSEMVGEFAWNALRVFTHISSFRFWKGLLFPFFFFKQCVTKARLLGQLKTRPRDLTAVLSIVTFGVVRLKTFWD